MFFNEILGTTIFRCALLIGGGIKKKFLKEFKFNFSFQYSGHSKTLKIFFNIIPDETNNLQKTQNHLNSRRYSTFLIDGCAETPSIIVYTIFGILIFTRRNFSEPCSFNNMFSQNHHFMISQKSMATSIFIGVHQIG
jgi:hypothetical protein